MRDSKRYKFERYNRWTTLDRFRGCKNFCDQYNATPLLEAMIVRSEALKSDLNLLIAFVGYSLL
jgi:hypothetical protein